MTEREVLLANITKTHNLSEEEAIKLLYDKGEDETFTLKSEANEILYSLETKRVKSFKDSNTETINRVANEKTGQINASWERRIKEQFGITDDLKGDDLWNKAVEAHKALAAGKGKDKNSPEYIELEMKAQKTAKELADYQAKIESDYVPKTEVDRRVRLYDNFNYADQVLAHCKFIPDDDAIREQTKRNYFKQELSSRFDDVQTIDGKRIAFKNGERLNNNLGHPVLYDDIVKEVGLLFWPIAKQSATGNGDQRNNGGGADGTGRMAQLKAIIDNPQTQTLERFNAQKELAKLELEATKPK
jgi:hypothetical protein